jgi:hypothetical protein
VTWTGWGARRLSYTFPAGQDDAVRKGIDGPAKAPATLPNLNTDG